MEKILGKILSELTEMRGDMKGMRVDITELRSDMTEVRGDITELRGDMTEVRGDITELRGDMTEVRGDITELRGDMTEVRGDITELKQGQNRLEAGQKLLQKNLVESLGLYTEKIIEHNDDKTAALNKRVFKVESEIENIMRQ